jgi:hypothetical protein
LLLIGLAAFLALVALRGTGNAYPDTFSSQPAQLYHPDKKAPISKAEIRLARRFIETAVARQDLNASYDIVHPDLKGRLTLAQWDRGDIPVITYAAVNAASASFTVDYSFQTSALLEVVLIAKLHTETRPELLFFLGLKRAGGKTSGRWLVSYWEPDWRPPMPMAP